jgi:hypothetical protein
MKFFTSEFVLEINEIDNRQNNQFIFKEPHFTEKEA